MKYTIMDTETNGLLDTITLIWCIGYADYEDGVLIRKGVLTTVSEYQEFLATREILVCHNLIMYDFKVFLKILGIEYKGRMIDTLGISWHMFPIKGFKHGLGAWGEKLGFPKPVVEDHEWAGYDDPVEKAKHLLKMIERVEGDVEITSRLFHEQLTYLKELYSHGGNLDGLLHYISFKMDCLLEQQDNGIPLNVELCETTLTEVEGLMQGKLELLSVAMPPIVEKEMPKKMYKINGMLSVQGEKWMARLKDEGLPEDTEVIYGPGNPGSDPQLKSWLFSLGWEPITFKLSKNTGKNLPQVSLPFGGGICPSVEELYEEYPVVEELENYYMLRHRAGLFKSFLTAMDSEGKVYSRAQGFTNTMRLKHSKPIANLPKVEKPYGKQIRGAFMIPDDNHIMVGSDISGLEDNTKQHYIYFYDPDYVTEMRVPGFDAHIDIGVLADMLTKDDEQFFKDMEAEVEKDRNYLNLVDKDVLANYKRIKKIRGSAKTVNFSATYGAGAAKIAVTLKCDLPFAQRLHYTYWKRNAAVKKTAAACKVVTIKGQKWLYNPVSQFWMFLKAEKDRFSTLNQSTGVFVFDSWLRRVRVALKRYGIPVLMQYHDEIMLIFKKGYENTVGEILRQAMKEVNEELKLNIDISVSVEYGNDYGSVH